MKRISIAFAIAALTVPLWAQTTTTAQDQDSPLVKAAKAAKKTQVKKSIVITNDNLMKTGGHIYIANASPNPPASAALPPPDTSVSKVQAELRAKAEAEAKVKTDADAKAAKDAAAKREAKLRAAAEDFYGESIEERVDDPATQEHMMNQMTPAQPPTAQPTKPPQQ